MTTAEKRAQLIREGEAWPDCECHGEPQYWQTDHRGNSEGYFKCAVRIRESHNRNRAQRRADGGCVHCGGELATGSLCERHADEHADFMADPYQRMLSRSAKGRQRMRGRADEGFQPSGVGLAAFAAYIKQPGS